MYIIHLENIIQVLLNGLTDQDGRILSTCCFSVCDDCCISSIWTKYVIYTYIIVHVHALLSFLLGIVANLVSFFRLV